MLILLLWDIALELDVKKKKELFLGKLNLEMELQKTFVSPITTKPWGKFIPKLADGDKPNQGEINSQRLYTEPEGLNIDGELPVVPKESFKKGVYY
jgi:adenylylsulfate reductase subunit B